MIESKTNKKEQRLNNKAITSHLDKTNQSPTIKKKVNRDSLLTQTEPLLQEKEDEPILIESKPIE